MFVAWTNGAELVSVPENSAALAPRLIRDRNVTGAMIVPSVATQAMDRGLLKPGLMPSLRHTWFLGEALPAGAAAAWALAAPASRITNTYGPTEATILMSWHDVGGAPDGRSVAPIGKPLPGMDMAVFDDAGNRLGIGGEGELHLAGPQLTPGYWLAPHLDAERFVERDGMRWYRTGDVARLEQDIGYVFLGRLDRQVKINGYRVELQEIEGAVRRASGREQVAVLPHPVTSPGNATGTVAFIAGEALAADAVLAAVASLVPHYMVPREIIAVDDLPLNANGKVDYGVLAKRL
jgi:D-alanine--poly(phosphoribitol) ligase subunit 1